MSYTKGAKVVFSVSSNNFFLKWLEDLLLGRIKHVDIKSRVFILISFITLSKKDSMYKNKKAPNKIRRFF